MEVHRKLGDRYTLLAPLGHGGMAVVWRAHDEVLGRTVAVKVLAARHAGDPESRARIRHEARAAAALSHPNITQVYDYGEQPDGASTTPYVVMELVRGGTLQDRMAQPVPPKFAMRVGAEVAAALAAAHADGLVHRDIKPANVMLTPSGAKVVDFGIAAAINPSGSGDPDAEVFGTPAYLAPERLIDDAVDPASDVYALGVLLYRLLSGHSPWSADTTTQMLSAHIYVDPEPLVPLPEVPGYVTELCNRCLSKDLTLRPSAREVAALLAQAAGLRVVADSPAPVPGATLIDPTPSVLIRRDPGPGPTGAAADLAPPPTPPAAEIPAPEAGSGHGVAAPMGRHARRERARRDRRAWIITGLALLVALAAVLWSVLPRETAGRSADAQPPPVRSAPTTAARAAANASDDTTATEAPGDDGPGADRPTAGGTPAGGRPAPGTSSPGAGAGPTGTGTPTTSPPVRTTEPTEPETHEWTFSSTGGSVRATCAGPDRAELLDWSAAKPYKVQETDPGPSSAPSVTFKHGNRLDRLTVTCSGGVASSS
ncbi:hypothetical protein Asp14428_01080 [Actinoplanes sp. NBRC 14428]|uniref:non-specific serine/threonine protein kinase n=1 Tax=Pseudosporangium ferrugineum TaxID=439699 RepID=A0A2T0SIX9_9ACTN|nr:serine/threonine-protein kinase [Pseudosporangium ferrugineum]PRY33367.1 serine/threonine protein kinase [Pseudosporangium ferrugineum]BCJ48633.1 hypothetical protein Asp14428_01080 [Actinoplanes sp. NBRC 14428]